MTKESLFSVLFQRFRPPPPQISPELPKETDKLQPDNQQIYSDHQLLVGRLVANKSKPAMQEQILSDYLSSTELLNDTGAFGQFLSHWLLEFFQQVDTGDLENLFVFISESDSSTLPRDLQKAQRDIFEPIFKLSKLRPKEVKVTNIFQAGLALSLDIESRNQPLPNSVIREYQEYVEDLTRLEAGMASKKREQNTLTGNTQTKRHHKYHPPTTDSPPETISSIEESLPDFSFWLITSKGAPPVPIENLEALKQKTAKVLSGCKFGPKEVWEILNRIAQKPPLERTLRSPRVAFGTYQRWTKIKLGKTGLMRLIFSVDKEDPDRKRILFKIGPHDTIYETRLGKDNTRSL